MKVLSCLSLLLGAVGIVLGVMGDLKMLIPGAILWSGAIIALAAERPETKKAA